jgi:hypothetical protein
VFLHGGAAVRQSHRRTRLGLSGQGNRRRAEDGDGRVPEYSHRRRLVHRRRGSAKAALSQSHLAAYLLHHLGSLYQYHDGDFTHWINEAKAAMSMAPYETLSRSDLPSELANAGEAIAWAEQAVSTTPDPPPWYYESLAWAYYVGQSYDDALKAVSRYQADFPALYAAICVRLGRLEARRAIADPLKAGTKLSIAKKGSTPQIAPQRTAHLNDLRAARAPEN